jgi:hypothetical protein
VDSQLEGGGGLMLAGANQASEAETDFSVAQDRNASPVPRLSTSRDVL